MGIKILLKYLGEHEVDINKIVYKNVKIHLFDTCQSSNKNLIKYLLDYGVKMEKENKNNETPLFKACEIGNKDIV